MVGVLRPLENPHTPHYLEAPERIRGTDCLLQTVLHKEKPLTCQIYYSLTENLPWISCIVSSVILGTHCGRQFVSGVGERCHYIYSTVRWLRWNVARMEGYTTAEWIKDFTRSPLTSRTRFSRVFASGFPQRSSRRGGQPSNNSARWSAGYSIAARRTSRIIVIILQPRALANGDGHALRWSSHIDYSDPPFY